ncbi:hypothetical protein E2C01_029387 [Portunus trituberculatus]|uniref:Uncharacterized protein n=1 Tax=Portunus trituberculatus TaxID=210409 RepID=A0A5B7ERR2_PORTR|nr:hypothetical protein [Portunus trituberculatus]
MSRGPGQPPHENLRVFFCFPISKQEHKRLAPRTRKVTYWDYNGIECWLPWTGYLVPIQTNRFNKRPHMMRMFVHDRAETPLLKHPTLDTQPFSTGWPLLGDPSSGWLRWSTGSLRTNHLV